MKKFLLSLVSLLMFAIGSMWAVDVTLSPGTNATTCTVNEMNGVKVGTSSKGGDMTITVPANTTKLTFYAAAWKGVTDLTVEISGLSEGPLEVGLTPNDGISNNSPFTLSDGTNLGDYMLKIPLSDVTEETTLTLSANKRFVVWNASAEVEGSEPGSGGSESTSPIQNADFSSTEGWTTVASGQFNALGNGLIGTYSVYGDTPNPATVDESHLATEYCFGFECRWDTNFASYTQTINLPAGNYELSFDVQNVNASTTKANYENRFTVTVGETVYTDQSVEWMNGNSAWTTHTIAFSLEAAADVTISLGYGTGTNNIGSANTPILYVSHLALAEVEELPADPYETALAAIGEGGTFFISTDVNGTKYYITAEGKLTSVRAEGCIFSVSKVEGNGYKQFGYYINGGKHFTNAPMSNNQAVLNVSSFSTSTNNRSTWEAQVLFLEGGKYAIRACNTAYGESSWEDCGRVFFTWKVEDAAVIPQYTYDQVYQWDFEAATSINVTYQLYEADGTTPVGDPVVVMQEANSPVSIPTSITGISFNGGWTPNAYYTYEAIGVIGDVDCTVNVTRTPTVGVVHALTDLSNAKAYAIRCKRGALLTSGDAIASTSHASLHDAAPANFAILSYEDNLYLYSVADKKFVLNNGSLASMPTHGVYDAIVMTAQTDPFFLYTFKINDETTYGLNTNGTGELNGCVINSWTTPDDGDQYYMIEAADFDATEALQALEDFFHPSYYVTYVVKDAEGNVLFTSEPAPAAPGQQITSLPDDYKKGFTTYNEVDVTITEPETTVEFTATPNFPFEIASSFAGAKWYNMTIRGDYWVAMDETEPYYPKADKDLDANASKWAFQGDAYNGITILNRAAGEGKTLTNDGGNVVMRDGAFKWEIFANSDGFVMRPLEGEGVENMWVNQNGGSSGPLQFWNSAAGKTDNGSTFRITPATPVYAITCLEAENGSVSADFEEAKAGETIHLTITPAEGYELDVLALTYGEERIELTKKSFEMPAADVTVSATFKVAGESPKIYIETDLTAQFPVDYQGWSGATGYVGWAAPAVTTNDGRETAACEKYEGTCANTGDVFTRTLTGLANGTYNIELYGAAAFTSGRGFDSELVEGDETAVYLYAETPAGQVKQYIPAHIATEFNSTGIATASLDNVVVTDGTIKIGMFKDKPMTNWHVVQIKGVTAKVDAAELLATTVANAKAIDPATLSTTLASKLSKVVDDNDGTYATADEYVAAISAIEAVIAEAQIYVVAAPKLEQMKKFVDATNFYTAGAKATYYDEPKQKLDEGTLTMTEANALQDPYAITQWHAANAVDDLLCSVWDVDPEAWDALHVNTWSTEGNNDGTEFKVPFFEYWTNDGNSLAEKTMTATFEGLEPGKTALVNVWVRVRAKNDVAAADATGITLQVNEGEAVDVTEGATNGQFNLAKYAASGVVDDEGKLVVKFIVAAENNISWLSFQNAKYELLDDASLIEYAAALYNIEDGANYSITTQVDEVTYYLTADGKLTADESGAGIFGFKKVAGAQYGYGFLLTSQNNTRFSNPKNTDEASLTLGSLNTSTSSRSDWEAQVFFLNAEGKYAVRATNASYNGETSGWSWIGNTYWAVHEGPLAEYSWEKSYDFELLKVNTVKVTYALYDVEGEEPVQTVEVTQKVNSEVAIPTAFTSVGVYNYAAEGTIGTENCTIKVTRTYKPGLIFSMDELSNNKTYTIACDRGALLTKDGYLASTGHSSLEDAEAAQFAILYYDESDDETDNGSYYLYSVADQKFVTNNGALADVPTNGVEDAIKMNAENAPYFLYYFTIGGTDNGLNTNGNDPYGYVINTWMTADAGNQYYMVEAADFDPATALTLLQKGAYLLPLRDALAANEPNPVLAGAGLFQKPQEAYDAYKLVYDAQKQVAENEASTIDDLITAKALLDAAIETYAAVEVNKPEVGAQYAVLQKSSGTYMSVNAEGGVRTAEEAMGFELVETEEGYFLKTADSYIGLVSGSTKDLTAIDGDTLFIAVTPSSVEEEVVYYTIKNLRSTSGSSYLGTVGKGVDKAIVANQSKTAANSQWSIVKYEAPVPQPASVELASVTYGGEAVIFTDGAATIEGCYDAEKELVVVAAAGDSVTVAITYPTEVGQTEIVITVTDKDAENFPNNKATYTITFSVATGIEGIRADEADVVFDMNGRRVSRNAKGVLIINGKKVIRK